MQVLKKKTPNGNAYYAIGSHHALDTFTNSAMTRMNVDDMNLNISIKYTINSISYMSASASALIMVQDGVHSFADQLVSVSIGNFIGLFFYEFFLYDTEHIQSVKFYTHKDLFYITTSWKF